MRLLVLKICMQTLRVFAEPVMFKFQFSNNFENPDGSIFSRRGCDIISTGKPKVKFSHNTADNGEIFYVYDSTINHTIMKSP